MQRDLASVAFGCGGIMLIAAKAPDFAYLAVYPLLSSNEFAAPESRTEALGFVFWGALPLMVGAALVFGRNSLADRLYPGVRPSSPDSIARDELQQVAFAAVGLLLVILGGTRLVAEALLQIRRGESLLESPFALGWLIQFSVGLVLLLGTDRIAASLSRARRAGHFKPPAAPD